MSEERFDKIRFYLKNGKYPNGADRAEKSRLRSAATHYKLTPETDDEPEKLWLKGKEVIADPKQQMELAQEIHHKQHGGINKTTAAIAELYHWVRIKETVSVVIRNCPECSEMNKGLSAMRQGQNQARAEARSESRYVHASTSQSSTPPNLFPSSQPRSLAPAPTRSDSPSTQLQMESAQYHTQFPQFSQHDGYNLPVDPALMHSIQSGSTAAELPPSPFLTAGQDSNGVPQVGNLDMQVSNMHDQSRMSLDPAMDERAPTAREELRRRLNRVSQYS